MRRSPAGVVGRIGAVALMVVAGLAVITTADAAVVSCGDTITQNTVLGNDVGPCSNNGIVIGANNITLDLNGHRIFGTPNSGDGAGVLVRERQGVRVRRGTVNDFDGGVVILGGSGNSVTSIIARHNIGASQGHPPAPSTLYGDGILVQGSSNNSILSNTADDNGPYGGISLITGDSDHPAIPPAVVLNNLVQFNSVTNNVACRLGPFCDNDGIRIEPRVGSSCLTGPVICPGPGNRIISNKVTGNGLDGIALFGFTTANLVQSNNVSRNGFNGAVRGDGIRVFGSGNTIQSNIVDGNAAGGVSVGRRPPSAGSFPNANGRDNRLSRNSAQGNGVFDLWDSNRLPDCDGNVWSGNIGATAAPSCTLNP